MASDNRIAFLGTPDFAVPSLALLAESKFRPDLVITQPDRPVGRHQTITPSPVKTLAQKFGITIAQPASARQLTDVLAAHNITLGIVVAYGQLISAQALSIPKNGFLNVHPSLLPRYRGAAPIQAAILHGDTKTGVTIIKLVEALDAGPIINQTEVLIEAGENAPHLSDRLAKKSAEFLVETISGYLDGNLKPVSQNERAASMTKPLTRDDGRIDWQKTAQEIDCQFRAFYPWPGVFTHWQGKRLKIENLSVLEGNFEPNLKPGAVFEAPNGSIAVACGAGAVMLETIQIEGKKSLAAKDFIKGSKVSFGYTLS